MEKTQNVGLEYLPYKFTSKELDEETGLYYYGARYLDPKYSRWISTDPALSNYMSGSEVGSGGIYNPNNLSLYHYANNNPVRYTDPTGMWIDNPDGTSTAQEGDTLWEKYGADWQKKSGFTGDPRTLKPGDTVGQKRPTPMVKTSNHDLERKEGQLTQTTCQTNVQMLRSEQTLEPKVSVYGLNPRIALVLGVGGEAYYVQVDKSAYIVLGVQGGCGVEIGIGAAGAKNLKDLIIQTIKPSFRDTAISNVLNHSGEYPIPKFTQQAKASAGLGMSYDMKNNTINGIEIGNIGGGTYWGARAIWKIK